MKSPTLTRLIVILYLVSAGFSLTTKKTETILGYFNDLQSGSNNSTFNSTSTAITREVSNKTSSISDWLEISSPEFINQIKFPPVFLPDNKQVSIKVDKDYYRINDLYSPDKVSEADPPTDKSFFFRLIDTHLYYSLTKSDLNVLGAISMSDIEEVEQDNNVLKKCIRITDVDTSHWLVCAQDKLTRTKWMCAINKHLGKMLYGCDEASHQLSLKMENTTVFEQKEIQPFVMVPMASRNCNDGWSYINSGKDWECVCTEGKQQSPIDLPQNKDVIQSPVAPVFQYEEVSAKSPITTLDGQVQSAQYIKLKYFKNALRIFHPNMGRVITLDGSAYVAEEIVFHTPSEHKIDGKTYDMEMQVIHFGQTEGDIAKQVILSFLFQKKPGVYNQFIDDVDFFSLPNPIFKERDIINNLYIPKIFYSSTDDDTPEMKPFSFYTYEGSLTAPPCTERTIHYVAAEPIPIGSSLLELLREALRAPDLKDNYESFHEADDTPTSSRLTQPLNGRPVFYYDHEKYCGIDIKHKKTVKSVGHYEKLNKKATQYFYVNGNEPSSLPGAFVVDAKEAKRIN